MAGEIHQAIISACAKWAANAGRCYLVCTDLVSACGETPDVMGWNSCGSIMIEVKASRSDFLADSKKPHRHPARSNLCLGNYRYYASPKGLIKVEELPELWGLLEFDGSKLMLVKKAEASKCSSEYEKRYLLSLIRRIPNIGDVPGVKCRVYTIKREDRSALATVGIELEPAKLDSAGVGG